MTLILKSYFLNLKTLLNILVTGGAGYIGSITAFQLQRAGHRVVIYDHLNRGSKERVGAFELVVGDTANKDLVTKTLADYQIEAVIHFAAWIEAGESMKDPGKYFTNNVYGTLQLIEAMVQQQVKKLVFSSTAAVYGIPKEIPIKEDAEKAPVNAYGESKLIVERMLRWYDQIHGLRSMVIRYFNAAGAIPVSREGFETLPSLGEAHEPATHLIPNVIKAAIENRPVRLFGDDYQTPDGTCIRDYIHVLDLASAHMATLDALSSGHASDVYNAGTGNGFTNREIIAMVEEVSGKKIEVSIEPRRHGDSDRLIADSTKLQTELGWHPQHSDLRTIIESAWKWHNR